MLSPPVRAFHLWMLLGNEEGGEALGLGYHVQAPLWLWVRLIEGTKLQRKLFLLLAVHNFTLYDKFQMLRTFWHISMPQFALHLLLALSFPNADNDEVLLFISFKKATGNVCPAFQL